MSDIEIIYSAVYRINQDIYENSNDKVRNAAENYGNFLDFSTDGYATAVTFMGLQIWCSEDDDRKYDEEKGEYEPMEAYLVAKIREVTACVKDIVI